MYNTDAMFLIYRDSEGRRFTQHWQDLTKMGTLIDPETGEDLELIGWHSAVKTATQAEVQEAWHAGLDEGREQGKGNEHCRAEPQPVAWQFQDRDGKWHGFVDEQHRQNTIADGSWPMRALYAAPPSVPEAHAQGGGEVEYEFEVWQDESLQAGGSTSDYATAKSEAEHYAIMYEQDGPVEVRMYEKRRITASPSAPVEVEDNARAMFEAQADKLAAPWDRQWEPTKGFWRKRAAEALAQQPAADGYCVTREDGECVSSDLRCMHNKPAAVDEAMRKVAALDLTPDGFDQRSDSQPIYARNNTVITVGDVRKARAALNLTATQENDDVVAGLIEALEWYIENDDTNEGDTPLSNHGGLTWNEINKEWLEGRQRAFAAIARARAWHSSRAHQFYGERHER